MLFRIAWSRGIACFLAFEVRSGGCMRELGNRVKVKIELRAFQQIKQRLRIVF